jgi:hypothetical protein
MNRALVAIFPCLFVVGCNRFGGSDALSFALQRLPHRSRRLPLKQTSRSS